MFTSITAALRYFDSVHQRTMRDIGALPAAADGWTPPSGWDEGAWSINTLIGHIATTRLFFVRAYRGEGWRPPPPSDPPARARWLTVLTDSAAEIHRLLEGTPDAWLERRIPMMDTEGSLSGARILLLMAEHEIHHRSQIDTYAGLNGWRVPHLYGRGWEEIQELSSGTPEESGGVRRTE